MCVSHGACLTTLDAELRERDRELWLATLYAPAGVRPALVSLFALDAALRNITETVSDPMVGAIRLAWWRDALRALDGGRAPDEPHLQAIAKFVLPMGVSGADLAGLEERWGCRLASDLDETGERAAEAEGGALLFGLAGRLLGGDEALAAALGRGWAVGQGWNGIVVGALRPLLALAMLGMRDAEDVAAGRPRAARAGAGRQLRMLWAVASGR